MSPLQLSRGCVLIEASRQQWGVYVQYIGPSPEALQEAGCITPAMQEAIQTPAGHGSKRRRDEDGDEFCRSKRPTKAQPHRVMVIRYIRSSEQKALRLAGVREMLAPAGDLTTSQQAAVWSGRAVLAAEGETEGGLTMKQRTVGRFQRAVEYATCENLIVPNWMALVAERLAS